MHLLPADTRSLDAAEAAVDLGQSPGEIVVLSFTDADSSLAGGLRARRAAPALAARQAAPPDVGRSLSRQRLPRTPGRSWCASSAGSTIGATAPRSCAALARAEGIALAFIPGDGRPDARLAALSTVPEAVLAEVEAYWREGGRANVARVAAPDGAARRSRPRRRRTAPEPLPKHGVHALAAGGRRHVPRRRDRVLPLRRCSPATPRPIDALAAALERARPRRRRALRRLPQGRGERRLRRRRAGAPAPGGDPQRHRLLRAARGRRHGARRGRLPGAAGRHRRLQRGGLGGLDARAVGEPTSPCMSCCPSSTGGSSPASSRSRPRSRRTATCRAVHRPHGERHRRRRRAAPRAGRGSPRRRRADRRLALVLSNYPGAEGRLAHAVGLDAPASALAILRRLAAEGYAVDGHPGGRGRA